MRYRSILCSATFLALMHFIPFAVAANNTAAVARVGEDIRYLASDELEGRGPGTKGLELAADYIREEFKELGLKSGSDDGSYFQPFEIVIDTKAIEAKTSLVLTGPDGQELKLELGKDFQPLATGAAGEVKAEVVFAGYGIAADKQKYNDFKDADVEGKVILIIRREPQQGDEKSVFDGKKVTNHAFIRTKIGAAKKHKAAAILMVNDPFTTKASKKDELATTGVFGTRPLGVPFAQLTQSLVNQLLKSSPIMAGDRELATVEALEEEIDKSLKPMTQKLKGWTAELKCDFEKVKTEVVNVVGVVEGQGKLADETIVIGAHYDHLGYGPFGSRRPNERVVHPGADDNATGTASVMELARRFAQRDGAPARRMVFIAFSAEERGLIGSNYYVEHPLFPLEKTVAMINFDMVGRLGDKGLSVGGARSAKEFSAITEVANKTLRMKVNTTAAMGGSDHAAFFRKKIPVLYFFTGLTKEYHTPDDTFETINVDGVVQTIDYAEQVLDGVVELAKRPEYQKVARTSPGRGAMAYLGVVPDYSGTADGLRITDVNADSPAAKGGLKAGDVITKIGDVPVGDIQGLAAGLRKYKAGQKVKIVVTREKKSVSVDVELGKPPAKG